MLHAAGKARGAEQQELNSRRCAAVVMEKEKGCKKRSQVRWSSKPETEDQGSQIGKSKAKQNKTKPCGRKKASRKDMNKAMQNWKP